MKACLLCLCLAGKYFNIVDTAPKGVQVAAMAKYDNPVTFAHAETGIQSIPGDRFKKLQMTEFEWKCKTFDELTVHELYAIMRLRAEIFVVEQNCVFQDADDKDQFCYHLTAWHDGNLAAYARLVPGGITYTEMSIGRIITARSYRGAGAGKQLVANAILKCTLIFGKKNIKIGAQLYLKKFYESFGFQQIGEGYMEDGIAHIHMLKI